MLAEGSRATFFLVFQHTMLLVLQAPKVVTAEDWVTLMVWFGQIISFLECIYGMNASNGFVQFAQVNVI